MRPDTMALGIRFHSEDGWNGLVADETWQQEFRQLDVANKPSQMMRLTILPP